jgi:pyridoxamine 5'-phosphate oxidase
VTGKRKSAPRSGLPPELSIVTDPIAAFERWLDDARAARITEPEAMMLATATPAGVPSGRMVLLKSVDARGFVFYTNYRSRKGQELAANPNAALVFWWGALERQINIAGRVERVTKAESDAYFRSRPLGSRLGALASRQSSVLTSRAELDRLVAELTERHRDGNVPRPDWWGGFRLIPRTIEFWQGRTDRLHDRLRYSRTDGGDWNVERLFP